MRRFAALVLVVGLVLGVPTVLPLVQSATAETPAGTVTAIQWPDLVPPDYRPAEMLKKYRSQVGKLRDNDRRGQELADELRAALENAPVVEALNGKTVKLSGFLVTLEGDGTAVSEFLLVPFFGACIHVPPPPSNQIVLVRTGARPFKIRQSFEQVSVTGRLRTERARNELASASYVIEATQVERQTQ
jgi:hypothetical protein